MQNQLKFEIYGKILWLWSNSSMHCDWPTHLQARFVIPAIANQQYYILEDNGFPVAYFSWAFLDLMSEKKYLLNPNSLELKDWKSGDRLWFMEYISPFSSNYTRKLNLEIAKIFPDYVGRSIRIKPGTKRAKVQHFKGPNVSRENYRKIRAKYLREFYETIRHDESSKHRISVNAPTGQYRD